MNTKHEEFGHVMIDLETMGESPRAAIVAIAAVEFNLTTGATGREFYNTVSLESCLSAGLKVDASTVEWWMRQSDEARVHLLTKQSTIWEAIIGLEDFFSGLDSESVKVWGNSARFDLGILSAAYRAIGFDHPWKYWNERDVRTLVSFNSEVKKAFPFDGVAHSALDDCRHQIRYCSAIYNSISVHILSLNTDNSSNEQTRQKAAGHDRVEA